LFMKAVREITKPLFADQCILNAVCKGRVKYLEYPWNSMQWKEKTSSISDYLPEAFRGDLAAHPKILHFTHRRPWVEPEAEANLSSHFWRNARLTPYFEILLIDLIEGRCKRNAADLEQKLRADIKKTGPLMADVLSRRRLFLLHQLYKILAFLTRGARREAYAEKRRKYANRRKAVKAFLRG